MSEQADVAAVYRVVAGRMPHHAGGMRAAHDVSAARISDEAWMRERLGLACRLYRCTNEQVVGTVWWYSASSVLVAPSVESAVLAGIPLDPGLDAITLHVEPDGRFLGARSSGLLPGGIDALGPAYRAALEPAIEQVSSASGARVRALWAIAADSLGNRLLWAGQAAHDVGHAVDLAERLAEGIGSVMPRPRYTRYGTQHVVRRVSCCLIDRATGQEKCTSCPNQHPEVRESRIRAALGV